MVREFLAVAARAVIQWAVATLLLANGAAFCLIAAVSERLRLGPPCILCARVHRLLCSSAAAGDGRDALRLLLCDAHLATVAGAGPEKPTLHGPDLCGSSVERKQELEADDRDKVSGLESHRVVSIGSEICEQDQDTNGISNTERAGNADDGNGNLVSLFELAPILAHPRDDGEHTMHKSKPPPELISVDGGERLTVGQLLSLRAQRRELDALRAELDAERRARVAAEEYQRELEEQSELDREAARLAMELVHETEREKQDLQRQLNACRVGTQIHGGSGGDNNNYQSLVDCLPGTLYSSSPDLANLLKLYNEPGSADIRQREGYAPAVTVVDEEVEEEEVALAVTDVTESSVSVDASVAVVADPLHERKYTSSHVEAVTEGP